MSETPVCRYFASGYCSRGDQCRYAHVKPKCRYFERGWCMRGEQCTFEHVQKEPRQVQRKPFMYHELTELAEPEIDLEGLPSGEDLEGFLTAARCAERVLAGN